MYYDGVTTFSQPKVCIGVIGSRRAMHLLDELQNFYVFGEKR
jgi:hypothetical protein